MTIIEAIQMIDDLKPNSYVESKKVEWLSNLDGMVYKEIVQKHENPNNYTYTPYTPSTPTTTELLIKAPYAEDIYINWLASKIDFFNGDYAKYNNDVIAYDEKFVQFRNYYNRTFMPLQENKIICF